MVTIKALEVSIPIPAYISEKALVNNMNVFINDLKIAANNMGVAIEEVYLDESTGTFVIRMEITDISDFAGQHRICVWITRVAKKHLKYE